MSSPSRAQTDRYRRRLERLCWFGALVLGLLQAWGRRHASAEGLRYIGADSISYLDLGDAYARGDWAHAINAMWSPCYSWLLGLTLRIFKPTPDQEFTAARLLNFAISAARRARFVFCLRALLRTRQTRATAAQDAATETHAHTHTVALLPDCALLLIGYTCFIWTALAMNRVARISPDLLVSVWVYLAAGLLLRARAGASSWLNSALLGLVLGVGYLTKTIMFPLAFVWLACAVFAIKPRRHGAPRVVVALLVFLFVAMPFVVALSRTEHRLTIGDSARLNYAWYVNRITPFTHWQGEPAGSGTPAHPTRQIFTAPNVYEFAAPVAGTYPPWYDPTYWYAGVTPHINLRQQAHASARNLFLLARFICAHIFLLAARDVYATTRDAFTNQAVTDDVQWQIASELQRLGVRPGAQVAIIGDAMYAAWPRLARVRVVAELPVKPEGNVAAFWTVDEAR